MAVLEIIIAAWIGSLFAAALWETFQNFLCKIIEKILPNKYGKKLSKLVKKIIGVIRRLHRFWGNAELVAQVVEASGQTVTVGSEYVEWSEVPEEVKQEIRSKKEYRYEQKL